MAGVAMKRFLVLTMAAIATVLFQLEEHVGPDIVGYGVAHMAFQGLGFVRRRVVSPMVSVGLIWLSTELA